MVDSESEICPGQVTFLPAKKYLVNLHNKKTYLACQSSKKMGLILILYLHVIVLNINFNCRWSSSIIIIYFIFILYSEVFFFYWYILKLLKFSPIKIKKWQVNCFKHLWLLGLLSFTVNNSKSNVLFRIYNIWRKILN